MKKVLFVVLRFYPDDGATSNCLMNICEYMIKQKINIHVVCLKANADEKDIEVFNGITIHRVMHSAYCAKSNFSNSALDYIMCILQKVVAHLCVRFSLAGLDILLIKKMTAYITSLYKVELYDTIVAVSGNYEMARAIQGSNLKSVCRAMYQVDPYWTNQVLLQKGANHRKKMEQAMYKEFDCVFTTPIIYHENEQGNGFDMSRTQPIEFPNIVNRAEKFETIGAILPRTENKIKILFTGYLAPDVRNPSRLWNLLLKMSGENICCYFIGNATAVDLGAFKEELSSKVAFLGSLPINQCFAAMQQADVLVNIGNNMMNQVPSKLFDYVSTGKPILNLAKSHKCPTLDYLKNYTLSLTLFDDEDITKAVEKMKHFCENAKGKQIPFSNVERFYYNHTPQYVAELIIESIEKSNKI